MSGMFDIYGVSICLVCLICMSLRTVSGRSDI